MLLFLLVFVACNSDSAKSVDKDTIVNVNDNSASKQGDNNALSGCYMQVVKRDTIAVKLNQSGNNITGEMVFDNFEKDGSSGPVSGEKSDGIIKLYYTFQSEGTVSVMEVYLKQEDNKLYLGTGDMEVRHDTTFFTNVAQLDFNKDVVLTKSSCDLLTKYFK